MKVEDYGQVFTPDNIVEFMLALRRNGGTALEPSAGDGAFFHRIPGCVGIELDQDVCPAGCLNMDFFDYDVTNKFATIIGNPPYVAYKNILPATATKLIGFDGRCNLYVHFINKCLDHLADGGELIFITPRDFMKATSSIALNERLFNEGTITHLYDLGDRPVFKGYSPNCVIWRFAKGDESKITNVDGVEKKFTLMNGMLLFLSKVYNVPFADLFSVKVGAVSGLDEVFTWKEGCVEQTMEFVCSKTRDTGETRRMYWGYSECLEAHRDALLTRRIKKFDEGNWWAWGRQHFISGRPRVYVNCKTRRKNPFFWHPCRDYDGSVLAVFPHDESINVNDLVRSLNEVDWNELGFVCDGRYLFSQRSLESVMLLEEFQLDYRHSNHRTSTCPHGLFCSPPRG
jgi:adenine-specific DNA-methyltransferase